MVKPSLAFPMAIAGAFIYTSPLLQDPIASFLFIQHQLMWDDGGRITRYCAQLGLCEDMKLFMKDSQKK